MLRPQLFGQDLNWTRSSFASFPAALGLLLLYGSSRGGEDRLWRACSQEAVEQVALLLSPAPASSCSAELAPCQRQPAKYCCAVRLFFPAVTNRGAAPWSRYLAIAWVWKTWHKTELIPVSAVTFYSNQALSGSSSRVTYLHCLSTYATCHESLGAFPMRAVHLFSSQLFFLLFCSSHIFSFP